jgi:hypothetical protein
VIPSCYTDESEILVLGGSFALCSVVEDGVVGSQTKGGGEKLSSVLPPG